jgi:teichuronic acid biosynthesis glycosyltransferase TuaG
MTKPAQAVAPPEVTVVVPAYNAERWLGETLDTLLAQRNVAFEVLVVDDRSTDGTAALVQGRAAAEPRLRYLATPQNCGGPAGPRNLGVHHARSEWVAFCDADDLWHPDKLRLQLDCARRTGADLVCTAIESIHEGMQPRLIRRAGDPSGAARQIGLWAMLLKNRVATSSVLCRRSALLATPGFNTERGMIAVEDYDMWLRLMAIQGVAIVRLEQPLVAYRLLHGSLSAQKWRQALKILRVHREIFALKGWSFAFPIAAPILMTCYVTSWLYLRGQVGRTPVS